MALRVVSAIADPNALNIKRKVIYGIEAQPFISQVTAMSFFVDTPQTTFTPNSDDEIAGQNPIPGGPVLDPPQITINTRRCIGIGDGCTSDNADFLGYVIAFQLTNPFDEDIVLEPNDPAENDSWYYLEYAKRYYRLVPQDPAAADGMSHNISNDDRTLKAGQTKTFFATYPSSLKDISDRFIRARDSLDCKLDGNCAGRGPDDGLFRRFANHEFGEDSVHVAAMYPETGFAIGAPNVSGLTNVDLFSIPSPDSPNALNVPAGSYREAQQDNFPSASIEFSDSRRVVYLWRTMRDRDGIVINGVPSDFRRAQDLGNLDTSVNPNWIGNDLMLDRLRDPSRADLEPDGKLVAALVRPFPGPSSGSSNVDVPGTEAGFDEPSLDEKDNSGFSMISWVTITRPGNPPRTSTATPPIDPEGKVPTGAMPPWCMETKPDNIYTPGFKTDTNVAPAEPATRQWSLNAVRGLEGIGAKARYSDSENSYYQTLDSLISKHTTNTSNKYVDPNLHQRFADRRSASDKAFSTSTARPYQNEHSISIIDAFRTHRNYSGSGAGSGPNGESRWYGPDTVKPRRFDEVAVEIRRLSPDQTGEPFGADLTVSGAPSVWRKTGPRVLFSRVGDFMLPLAIGPSFDPFRRPPGVTSSTPLADIPETDLRDAQWMTLSEALALATDYYSGPKSFDIDQDPATSSTDTQNIPLGQQPNIYYKFGRDTRTRLDPSHNEFTVPKADRGQLVLDAWSPYLAFSQNNRDLQGYNDQYVWSAINPGVSTSLRAVRDGPIGNGIPLALNILDKFRVAGLPAETRAKPSDRRLCENDISGEAYPHVGNMFASVGRSTAHGSATQLVPGLVNINTAPQAVLRLLPMLSPSRDTLNINDQNLRDSWLFDSRFNSEAQWLTLASKLTDSLTSINPVVPKLPAPSVATATTYPAFLWNPLSTSKNQTWDIAALFDAYRNRASVNTRRFDPNPSIDLNYRDDRPNAALGRSGRDDAFAINTEDRSQGGLRDQPGFRSVGEIMALTMKRSTDQRVIDRAQSELRLDYNGDALPVDSENSISRFALDGLATSSVAIASASYKQDRAASILDNNNTDGRTLRPGTPPVLPDGPSRVPDNYEEKLGIANSILNMITVRSDVFCIWFIINGYTPEDVRVDAGYPMVPSVARRYVMVVDRSNVDTPTTKPRIVMLREVPMP